MKAEIELKDRQIAEAKTIVQKLSDDLKLAHDSSVTKTEHKMTVDRLNSEMEAQRAETEAQRKENELLGKAVVERQRAQEAAQERVRHSSVEAEEAQRRTAS